jgi:hypothetical protein
MRSPLAAFLCLLFISTSLAFAQERAPAERPAGFDDFFEEMQLLVRKYPEAGKRFGLFDSKSIPRSGPLCGDGRVPCCTQYVLPCCGECATRGCCEVLK